MRFPLLCWLAALAALTVAGPARADADDPHAGGKDKHAPALHVKDGDKFRPATEAEVKAAAGGDAHGEKGGLDFTGIKRWDLGIYTLIVFGLLMFVLSKYAWPHMRVGLEKREANIRGALDEAKKEREDAKGALAAAKRQLDETAGQVKGMLDDARRDAESLKATERETGIKDAQAERERAKREIEAAKDAALKDIYDQAVRLAALMSEKALRRQVTAEDHRRLLNEALADLKSGGKA